MKLFVPLALCAASLIAGCASGPSMNTASNDEVDVAKVAAINHVANSRGVDVHWVAYPQRRTTAATPLPTATPGADGSSMVLPIGT